MQIDTGDENAVPVDDLVQRDSIAPLGLDNVPAGDGIYIKSREPLKLATPGRELEKPSSDERAERLNQVHEADKESLCKDRDEKISAKDKEIAALKEALTAMSGVLHEVQAQRNLSQDQAAQFGAMVMAMRRKYEPQGV